MPKRINPFGPREGVVEEARRGVFASRNSDGRTLYHYREREHPLEAALEEELGFTFYDSVLSAEEIAVWEREFGKAYVCPLRRIARSVYRNELTLVVSANGTGKTYQAGHLAALYPRMFPDDVESGDYALVKIGTAPPESNLDKIMGYVSSTAHARPALFKGYRWSGRSFRPTVNDLAGVYGQPFAQTGSDAKKETSWKGDHAPHMIIMLDEADGIPQPFFTAVGMNMIGKDNHLVCYWNPREPVGQVYKWYKRAAGEVIQISAFDHPNVITGEDRIPGAASRGSVVWEILEKSRPLSPGERLDGPLDPRTFKVPSFLEGCYAVKSGQRKGPLKAGVRVITDGRLATQVLGRYPAESVQRLYQDQWIDEARARWDAYTALYGESPPAHVEGRLGVDPSEGKAEGDDNAAVRRYGGYVPPVLTKPGIDANAVGGWAATLARSTDWPIRLVFIDNIGIGAGTATTARDGYTYTPEGAAEPVVVAGIGRRVVLVDVRRTPRSLGIDTSEHGSFRLLKDYLAWLVMLWLRHDPAQGVYSTAMLPPNEDLIATLRIIESWTDRAGLICTTDKDEVRSRLGGRSPNAFDALMATFAPVPDVPSYMTGAALMVI